ncbi:MAG: 30S ribosomal protein S12 methylthiotransferase RimO [Anaerolineales bacterium]|nr:30S ribosomal protein S12 methylthiotransferase RimO [Anaerolineales bacterium]
MSNDRFHLVSLGCAKNSVDSDSMAELLRSEGYQISDSPEQAEILIVNTCGFIGPAKDESLSVLRELAERKKSGQVLIAAGCLTQRYGSEIVQQVVGIDGILGTRRWMDIVKVVKGLRKNDISEPIYHLPKFETVGKDEQGVLRASIQGASAYLKIADGCRRPCAFCAIPLIKGTAVSRPIEVILAEAKILQERGIRELNLIAQDTTDYGHDLGMRNGLVKLLLGLVDAVPQIDWIRILYAYPGYVTDKLIQVMADHPQVLPYLDMPLQHAHRETLKRMRRPANMEWVFETIEKMRRLMPDLALRTTFIVGYPGETDEEYQTLLNFVRDMRFDRLGVFTFSFEPGTSSEVLGDPIPQNVKEARRDELMLLQQQISLEKNQSFVGEELEVLVEGYGDGISLGRSYRDAPEIDGMVLVEGKLRIGEIVPVRINGAMPYDLSGLVEGRFSAIELL